MIVIFFKYIYNRDWIYDMVLKELYINILYKKKIKVNIDIILYEI